MLLPTVFSEFTKITNFCHFCRLCNDSKWFSLGPFWVQIFLIELPYSNWSHMVPIWNDFETNHKNDSKWFNFGSILGPIHNGNILLRNLKLLLPKLFDQNFFKKRKKRQNFGKKRVFNKNEFQNVYPIFRDLGPYDSIWVHMIQFGSS